MVSENNSPFLVYGESGCGKTAILAKLADEVIKLYLIFILYFIKKILILLFNFYKDPKICGRS